MVILAPPSPYNKTTLDSIKVMVKQGRTVAAIAHALGWTIDVLRQRARQSDIRLPGDLAPVPTPPKAPVTAPAAATASTKSGAGQKRFKRRDKDQRKCIVAISVSSAALTAMQAAAVAAHKVPGGAVGVTLDYIARSGKFDGLLAEALAEEAAR